MHSTRMCSCWIRFGTLCSRCMDPLKFGCIWLRLIKAILQTLRSNSIVERPSSRIGKFLQHLLVIFRSSCQRLVVQCSTHWYKFPPGISDAALRAHLAILSGNYSCTVPTLVHREPLQWFRLLHCACHILARVLKTKLSIDGKWRTCMCVVSSTNAPSKSSKNGCRRELCEQGLSFTSDESNATIGRRRVNLSQFC